MLSKKTNMYGKLLFQEILLLNIAKWKEFREMLRGNKRMFELSNYNVYKSIDCIINLNAMINFVKKFNFKR